MGYKVTILEKGTENTSPVKHKGVGIQKGQYGLWKKIDDSYIFIPCGGAVYVGGSNIDMETGEEDVVLRINKDDMTIEVVMPREHLHENSILSLQKYGVQVTRKTASTLIKVLENLIQDAERNVKHEGLGFTMWKNKYVFKGYKGFGVDSQYFGTHSVTPIGSFEVWMDMVRSEVLGWTPLEFILSASVAGLLVDYLKEEIACENLLVHMVGNSSTGKTTAGLLAVSSGSSPNNKEQGMVFNFGDTWNSLMKLMPNSYPCLVDEGSLIPDEKNLTRMLYSMSSGLEKKRLTQNMTVGESSQFRTILFFTSEKSILAQCNNNSGLLVRNFEFSNVVWTKSASSADNIKEVIAKNHSHLIPKVVAWILEQDRMELIEKVLSEVKGCIERARKSGTYNNLTERTAKQTALLLTSVDILNEVLHVELNKNAIIEFMEEHSLIKETEQVSLGKKAMEWLLQFLSKNQSRFLSDEIKEGISGCIGRLEKTGTVELENGEKSKMRLYMGEYEFGKMLKEGKFSEKVTVLKEWKQSGYLKSQKDRYISRIKVTKDIWMRGYIIQLPIGNEDKETKHFDRSRLKKETSYDEDGFRPIPKDFRSIDGLDIDDEDDLFFPEDQIDSKGGKNESN